MDFHGISDLQFISDDGDFIAFLEVKTEKGKPTQEQVNFIDFINSKNSNHLRAGIVRSVEDAINLVSRYNNYIDKLK